MGFYVFPFKLFLLFYVFFPFWCKTYLFPRFIYFSIAYFFDFLIIFCQYFIGVCYLKQIFFYLHNCRFIFFRQILLFTRYYKLINSVIIYVLIRLIANLYQFQTLIVLFKNIENILILFLLSKLGKLQYVGSFRGLIAFFNIFFYLFDVKLLFLQLILVFLERLFYLFCIFFQLFLSIFLNFLLFFEYLLFSKHFCFIFLLKPFWFFFILLFKCLKHGVLYLLFLLFTLIFNIRF